MIHAIDLRNLRNPEFLQFSNDFLGIVKLNNPRTLNVQAEYNDFTNATHTIDALFKADRVTLLLMKCRAGSAL